MATSSIDVCICTFRRASLADTLASLSGQSLGLGVTIRVVVADNDDSDTRRAEIEQAGRARGLHLRYLHAPSRNISTARNACLTAASADWLAFIDDDEVAGEDWLSNLLAQATGADIVFGRSAAIYPPSAPSWMVEGDFHSNRLERNDPPWNGYTANVLISRQFLKANPIRFREDLGQTGGEDTHFFFEAHLAGARFGYAPDAVVYEPVEPRRARPRWLLLRRFRAGQIHYLLLKRAGNPVRASAAAAVKAIYCSGAALLLLPRPLRAASWALRCALHLGVVAAAVGFAPYREYRRP